MIEPPIVEIPADQRDKEVEVKLTNRVDVPLTPRLVVAPHESFEIDYETTKIAPGESATVRVRLADDVNAQTVKKSFTFELNDPPRTRLTLPAALLAKTSQAIKPTSSHSSSGH